VQTPVVGCYRWKTKDLERLPEEPFLSYEIIDGELIVSRKPHLCHAAIIETLCAQVYPAVSAKGGVLLVEPGIVWSEEGEDNVAPDIAIVLPDRLH
jgi:Putative restriction endonuclease